MGDSDWMGAMTIPDSVTLYIMSARLVMYFSASMTGMFVRLMVMRASLWGGGRSLGMAMAMPFFSGSSSRLFFMRKSTDSWSDASLSTNLGMMMAFAFASMARGGA